VIHFKKLVISATSLGITLALGGCMLESHPSIDDSAHSEIEAPCFREINFQNQHPYDIEIDFFDWTAAPVDPESDPIVTHFVEAEGELLVELEQQGYQLFIYRLLEDGQRELVSRRGFSFRCGASYFEGPGPAINLRLVYYPPAAPPRIEWADEPWVFTPGQRAQGLENQVVESFLERFPDSGVTPENFCTYVRSRHSSWDLLRFELYSIDTFKQQIFDNVIRANAFFQSEESQEELPEGEAAVTAETGPATHDNVVQDVVFRLHSSLARRWNAESTYAGRILIRERVTTDRYDREVLRRSLELNRGDGEGGSLLIEENYPVGTTEFSAENLINMNFVGSRFLNEDYFVDIASPPCFPSNRLWGHYNPRFFGQWSSRWRIIADENHMRCLVHTLARRANGRPEAYVRRQVLDLFSNRTHLTRRGGYPFNDAAFGCGRELLLREYQYEEREDEAVIVELPESIGERSYQIEPQPRDPFNSPF
jgi:hypothetical protein